MLDMELFRLRLKEAFGTDTQKMIAEKLHTTQGNVSKWLSSPQQPELDTLYNISETYRVSIDWLLGLTERKRIVKGDGMTTYALSTEAFCDLKAHNAIDVRDRKNPHDSFVIEVKDPLLTELIKKGFKLVDADKEILKMWIDEKLSLFDDTEIIWSGTWKEDEVWVCMDEATKEEHWREVHAIARDNEKHYAKMMDNDVGPFTD